MVRTSFTILVATVLTSASLGMASDARKRGGRVVEDPGVIPAEALPKGWRFPNQEELRDRGERVVQISADFNGDGAQDEAILLKSERFPEEGLWMWLSARGTRQWIRIDKRPSHPNTPLVMDIEAVDPGTYADSCLVVVKACKPGTPRTKLTLDNLGIVYQGAGGAAIHVWNGKDKRFQRLWASE